MKVGNGFSAAICKDKYDELNGVSNQRRDSDVGRNGESLLSGPLTTKISSPSKILRQSRVHRIGTRGQRRFA
jgi:hypothetical protein